MNKLLLGLVPGLWIAAMAVISVQNATPIAIKFLTFRSIEIPLGVAMGFCAATGMILTALLLFVWDRV
ncbi:MAG: lipopolysaccharide assembly protein LapA domain-containing protein [Cyanobacteria bacterium P01_A01_bin.123]